MKMNSTKFSMVLILILSSFMLISSNNMLFSWMSMEINLFVFMPMITNSNKMKDQPMKYFIIQSMSSSMLLMSILMNSFTETPISVSILLMTSMLMKTGMFPLHVWVPMLMYKLKWNLCFLLSTWQKILPTIIISQMVSFKLMNLPMMMSLIIPPIIATKQLSTKKIFAYSSISNMPWMISSMYISKQMFTMFLTIYSIILFTIMKLMKKMNMLFINQIKSMNKMDKLSLIVSSLSMSGMPPMTGFLTKWMILMKMNEMSLITSISMITSSMISMYIYMKLSKNIFMNSALKKKNKKKNLFINLINIINLMGLPMFLILKSI
uniref:NADH dehydrogenase subunit 2 n=1 Tax=Pitambara triremiprocta TaxID=3081123 RepID=UPI002A7F69A0|nr:NADH dehydrogenase subunit 2 [Pitambara triremiprocta]WOW99113.1 NADH dehydrogenase subunit 2 [Pitambara triremiprocta]